MSETNPNATLNPVAYRTRTLQAVFVVTLAACALLVSVAWLSLAHPRGADYAHKGQLPTLSPRVRPQLAGGGQAPTSAQAPTLFTPWMASLQAPICGLSATIRISA